jgi:hypothetical protein
MKYNKLATVLCSAALGLLVLTSCEGADLYSIDSPEWLSSRADSIAAAKAANQGDEEEIEGLQEDVYQVGAADFSTGWWAAFSKYYQIPEGQKWVAQFNLSINPAAPNTYKNFAMIICNDEDRGAANYREYGAIRYDNQPSGNSEWGDYIDRSLVTSDLTFETDTDTGVDKLGGKVTLTIDRTAGGLVVTITNGTVTKVYNQTSPLANLNEDQSNTTIRAFLVPEGSCINFLGSTIEPIGGFTSREDKLPIGLVLNGVPKKVLQGTTLEEAFANVTATVKFEQEVSLDVKLSDLSVQAVPDMNSLGKKTLIAAYAKTFKGEGATPVIGTAEFEVVDKMYTLLGAADNSSAWWSEHSQNIKVNPGETLVTTFTNYTSGGGNWNNFVVCLTSQDGATEYGILRSDNWGWGTGWAGEELASKCTPSGGQADWATWLAAMDGAKVTIYTTNNGDGTCDVKCVMLGNDGVTYNQDYIGLNTVTNPDDFYFHLTIDNCHLEFDDVLGADDNSSAWWSEHSPSIKVAPGESVTRRFRNYTSGGGNWNNFVVCLTSQDGATEYGILRSDNWGWGTGWAGEELASKCTPSGGQADWATWLAAMDDAMVTVTVKNNGDGTCDVRCVMLGNDGVTYNQDYIGLNTVTNPDDLWMHFTIDNCHLVFE